MSAQAMGWALDQDLPARPKLVLVAVANHADHTDGYCWLKAETIAAESSHSVRSVYRTLAALERNGYLRRQKRKGADGKQRANDYWMLFNREDAPFEWRKGVADDEQPDDENDVEGDAEPHASDIADPLDIDGAVDRSEQATSCGPTANAGTEEGQSMPPVSCGPTAIGVTAKESAEPSKTNPKNAGLRTSAPRSYRPPPPEPPQPVGSTTAGGNGSFLFVFKPSPAYDAWCEVRRRELRNPRWGPVTYREGKAGWYFPTLFPPNYRPPDGSLATDDELDHFAQAG